MGVIRLDLKRMARRALLLAFALVPAICAAQGVTSPYLQLVWRYRAGDTQRAVAETAALPTDALRARVLRDLGPHVCETLAEVRDCDKLRERFPDAYRRRVAPVLRAALPTAFLLHLHASSVLVVAGEVDRSDTHRELARVLLDRITPVEAHLDPEAAASLRAFRRQATALFAWLLQSDQDVNGADDFVRDALRAFPGDGELLLASGWVEETLALPPFLEQRHALRASQSAVVGGRQRWFERERGFRLARAADAYRQALAAQPALAEAQARLGRVLALQGRLDEARTVLAPLAASDHPRMRYLGALFTAGLEERAGAVAAARRWYDTALRIWPASQAARVSLGRLLARQGDRAGAAALIAMLPHDLAPLDQDADPWAWYQLGQSWRIEAGFLALRAGLRQ